MGSMHVFRRCLLLMPTACLLANCHGDDSLGSVAVMSGGSGGSSVGNGGAAGSEHSDFAEPELACDAPPLNPDSHTGELYFGVALAPEAHCGPWHRSYWLTGDETLALEAVVGIGTRFEHEQARFELMLVLDGVVTQAEWDGEQADRYAVVLSEIGSHKRISVRIPRTQIPDGAHSATVLAIHDDGSYRGAFSHDFSVFADGVEFPQLAEVDVQEFEGPGGSIRVLNADTGEPFPSRIAFPDGQPLRIQLDFAPFQDSGGSNVALLALLDGKQVPLGELGFVPAFRARGGHRVLVDWELAPPEEPGPHLLEIFWRTRFYERTEASDGEPYEPLARTFRVPVGYWLESAARD